MPVRGDGALTGTVVLRLANRDAARTFTVYIEDAAYGTGRPTALLGPTKSKTGRAEIEIELGVSHGWYRFRMRWKKRRTLKSDTRVESRRVAKV